MKKLTETELKVVELFSQGKSNIEISKALSIKLNSANNYLCKARQKTNSPTNRYLVIKLINGELYA